MKAADLVVAAGGFGLVALDLGEGRVNGARTGAAWNRLKHAAERQQTALLVATPWRTVGAFAAAAITLRARRVRFHRGHHGAAANGNSHCPPLLADLETTAARERGGAKQGAAESAEGDGACASLVFSSLS